MALDPQTLTEHVRTESERFATALAGVDAAVRVPSCPDWNAADLAWHLAEVHHFWATLVGERLTDPEAAEQSTPDRPGSMAELLALYDRTTVALLDALAGAADHDTVWTWAPEQSVGFVRRFQAHEALMHRVDAELTAGGPLTPLPPQLAEDGVDVVLRYPMSWKPDSSPFTPAGGVGLLRATDTGREWTLTLGTWSGTGPESGTVYEPQPVIRLDDGAEPTFGVSAPAADLDAWLWHRPGFGEVLVDGDAAHAERFTTQVARGVQ